MKSKTTALLLSIFTGGLGIDRFYLGYTGIGILKLLTAGCFGILALIDLINIATGRLRPADGSPYEEEMRTMPVQPVSDPYQDLEKLTRLHEQGAVSDEEYAAMKAELLKRM